MERSDMADLIDPLPPANTPVPVSSGHDDRSVVTPRDALHPAHQPRRGKGHAPPANRRVLRGQRRPCGHRKLKAFRTRGIRHKLLTTVGIVSRRIGIGAPDRAANRVFFFLNLFPDEEKLSLHSMKSLNEFVPLKSLVHSLENLPRLYFLYRQAAESGRRGGFLRFQWFRKRLDVQTLKQIESLFGPTPR